MSKSSHIKLNAVISFIMVFTMIICCSAVCASADTSDNGDQPELTKIADNLYEITFTEDFAQADSNNADMSGFSCSGVQNGQFRGRNYDWTYADTDLCIIHTKPTENRPHASVGVADLSFIGKDGDSYNISKIPFVTVDGINDAGVCIQVNVMPFGENGELPHTESAEDDLAGARLVRYILDNADSFEDALALLNGKDIHSEMDSMEELHWMISGPASESDSTIKTAVVEVFPDGLHITDSFVDNKPIMANFNVSNFDGTPDTIGLGFGYERWQILDENYDQASSVIGTFDLMEKVWFSKIYDLYGDRFWYSEYNGTNLSNYCDAEMLKGILGEETYSFYIENYGGVYYTAALWDGEKTIHGDISKTGILSAVVAVATKNYNAQNMEDGSLWITVHTSVYDLENRTLDIQVRESQDHLRFTIE